MGAEPLGVVLAGGAGRRLGGRGKAGLLLLGRPLSDWVSAALGSVVGEVVIAARADTVLAAGTPVVWREPLDGPRHPLSGVAAALERAGGRDVLCCPVDLPFVSGAALRALCEAPGPVVVVRGQPLLGRFGPGCATVLRAAAAAGAPVRATVAGLSPVVIEVADAARVLYNVNTPDDLATARAAAAAAARPPRRSGPPRAGAP